MAEKIFPVQSNYGWGLTLNMTGKAPAVSKRIFDTYNDAFDYANNVDESAIEGLLLTVVADEDTKNGVYFVKQVATKGSEGVEAKSAELVKLSTINDSSKLNVLTDSNLDYKNDTLSFKWLDFNVEEENPTTT